MRELICTHTYELWMNTSAKERTQFQSTNDHMKTYRDRSRNVTHEYFVFIQPKKKKNETDRCECGIKFIVRLQVCVCGFARNRIHFRRLASIPSTEPSDEHTKSVVGSTAQAFVWLWICHFYKYGTICVIRKIHTMFWLLAFDSITINNNRVYWLESEHAHANHPKADRYELKIKWNHLAE